MLAALERGSPALRALHVELADILLGAARLRATRALDGIGCSDGSERGRPERCIQLNSHPPSGRGVQTLPCGGHESAFWVSRATHDACRGGHSASDCRNRIRNHRDSRHHPPGRLDLLLPAAGVRGSAGRVGCLNADASALTAVHPARRGPSVAQTPGNGMAWPRGRDAGSPVPKPLHTSKRQTPPPPVRRPTG